MTIEIFYFKVRPVGNIGVMFLDEVVLGKEYFIGEDNYKLVPNPGSLTKSPKGYDSVVYLGGPKPGIHEFVHILMHMQEFCYDCLQKFIKAV